MFIYLLFLALFGQVINVRDTELLKQFGKHLRKLRNDAGFTQEELANEADIPINQIGRLERGEVNPTLSTLSVISKALKLTLSEIVSFK